MRAEDLELVLAQIEAEDRTSPARKLIDDLPLFAAARLAPAAPQRDEALTVARSCKNTVADAYRSAGFLAMPLAITSSNALRLGLIADGRGTGAVMCPAICCSRLSAG